MKFTTVVFLASLTVLGACQDDGPQDFGAWGYVLAHTDSGGNFIVAKPEIICNVQLPDEADPDRRLVIVRLEGFHCEFKSCVKTIRDLGWVTEDNLRSYSNNFPENQSILANWQTGPVTDDKSIFQELCGLIPDYASADGRAISLPWSITLRDEETVCVAGSNNCWSAVQVEAERPSWADVTGFPYD